MQVLRTVPRRNLPQALTLSRSGDPDERRGRTLQPARRRTLDPACPLRAAPRPEDRKTLCDWNIPTGATLGPLRRSRVSHRRQASPDRCSRQVSKGWSLTEGDESSSALGRRPQTEATGMFPRKVTTAGSSTRRSYEPPPRRADTAARIPKTPTRVQALRRPRVLEHELHPW